VTRRASKGKLPETAGSEMGAKRVIFVGFRRQKGGQKGTFGASKAGKKAIFCVPEGWEAGAEGFWGQNRTLCPICPAPENHPRGQLER